MNQEYFTIVFGADDMQQVAGESAQLAQLALTVEKSRPVNFPGQCHKCTRAFVLLPSIEMHHYFDKRIRIWVTRWDCTDIEYCNDCNTYGRNAVDIFETPRYPKDAEIWIRKKLKRSKERR
jgi:hypothetical protein